MEQNQLITNELSHAGEESFITPEILRLASYRVASDTKFCEEDFTMLADGKGCFPRKDLSIISGASKAGKTNLIAILLACATKAKDKGKLPFLERVGDEPLRVMWIDTEQSQISTQSILNTRIAKMIGGDFPEENFYVFNLRRAEVDERYDLLAEAVETYKPDFVVIDNIRDLVKDINNGTDAQVLIEGLMKMAEEFECNITAVIHQNRSADNRGLRGWLGTELMNKAFEVYTCQKILQKDGEKPVFCVEQTLTRKYDIDRPFYYILNNECLPEACDAPKTRQRDENGKFVASNNNDAYTFNQKYIIYHHGDSSNPWEWDLHSLFNDCFAGRASMGYQDLVNTAMKLGQIKREKYFNKVMNAAEKANVVKITTDRCGRVLVVPVPE